MVKVLEDMRKHSVVPVVLLAMFIFARPWDIGHTENRARHQAALGIRAGSAPIAIAGLPQPAEFLPTPTVTTPTPSAVPPTPTALPSPTAPATATAAPTATATPPPTPTMTATAPPTVAPTEVPPEPPTSTPVPVRASPPVRLIIPAIGLNLKPISVGLDRQRIPIVPKHDAGWFNGSAMPGQGSNIVLWGHVLRWKATPKIPAPFAHVQALQPGAEIRVVTADGVTHRYRVAQLVWVRPDQVSYILPTESERLTLVSCIGDSVIREGTLTKEFRLITIAEPAE